MEENNLENVLFKRAAGELFLTLVGKKDELRMDYKRKFTQDRDLIDEAKLIDEFIKYSMITVEHCMSLYAKLKITENRWTKHIECREQWEKELKEFLGDWMYEKLDVW